MLMKDIKASSRGNYNSAITETDKIKYDINTEKNGVENVADYNNNTSGLRKRKRLNPLLTAEKVSPEMFSKVFENLSLIIEIFGFFNSKEISPYELQF